MRKDVIPMVPTQGGGTPPVTITSTLTTREFPEFANFAQAALYLNVTAMVGAGGTFIVTIQEQDPVSLQWTDGSTNHPAAIVTFNTVTQAGPFPWTQRVTVQPSFGIRYRAVCTLATGATSVSFSLCAIVGTEADGT